MACRPVVRHLIIQYLRWVRQCYQDGYWCWGESADGRRGVVIAWSPSTSPQTFAVSLINLSDSSFSEAFICEVEGCGHLVERGEQHFHLGMGRLGKIAEMVMEFLGEGKIALRQGEDFVTEVTF